MFLDLFPLREHINALKAFKVVPKQYITLEAYDATTMLWEKVIALAIMTT